MLILSVHLSVQKVKEQVVLLSPLRTQHKIRNTRFTSLAGICQMKHCSPSCTDYWNMLILSVCLSVQQVKEQVVLLSSLRTQHKFRNTRFTSLPCICRMKHCYPSCTDKWNIQILHVRLYVQKGKEHVVLLGQLPTQHKFRNRRFTSLPGICQMKYCYPSCTDYWNMLILSVCLSVQQVKEQVVLLSSLRTQHKFRNARFTSLPGIC